MNINIVILDREKLERPVTVEFINPLTNAWILRLDIWANNDPELTVESAQLNPNTIEVFLGILRVGTNLLNRIHKVDARSFREVSDVVNASSDDTGGITFSQN